MTQLYKKNGLVFIPAEITVEESTGLKTRWQCRNKYMCSENGKVVPCYTLYDCLNCHYKSE